MVDNDDIFGIEPMMHLDQLTHQLEYLKDGIECIEIGLKLNIYFLICNIPLCPLLTENVKVNNCIK